MGIDFEKQIKEMQAGHPPVRIDTGEHNAADSPFQSTPQPEPEDPTAVHFPLQIWMLAGYVLAILGFAGWIVYSAVIGLLGTTLMPVYAGGAGMLFLLGLLPLTITLDSRGIHQSHFLGLWERNIPWRDVSFYWRATRRKLRQAGLLHFQSRTSRHQKGDHEEVIYVGSKSSKRHFLHTFIHRNREGFIRELEHRGVHPKGYEGWEAFMQARGVPVR